MKYLKTINGNVVYPVFENNELDTKTAVMLTALSTISVILGMIVIRIIA